MIDWLAMETLQWFLGGAGALYVSVPMLLKLLDNTPKIHSHHHLDKIKGSDGLVISKNIQLSKRASCWHVLTFAPTEGGKTSQMILPTMNKLPENCSFVATDPKGELAERYMGNKFKIVINLSNKKVKGSIGYDPNLNCKTIADVRKLAQILIINGSKVTELLSPGRSSDDGEWIRMCTTLLTACLIYNFRVRKYTFPKLINRMLTSLFPTKQSSERGEQCFIDEIMNSRVPEAIIEMQSFLGYLKSDGTVGSIMAVLDSNLNTLRNENVVRVLTNQYTLNLDVIRKKPVAVFIQVPEKDSAIYAPIISVMLVQMMDHLYDNKNGLQTFILLDELANIGYIPNLANVLTTIRSRSVSVFGCLQNINQLNKVYGDDAKVLLEAFVTKITMGGLWETSQYFSDQMGNIRVSSDKGTYEKPLKSKEEIRQLGDDDLLIIARNFKPVMDKKHDFAPYAPAKKPKAS